MAVENGKYLHQVGVFSHNPLHDLESLWWVGVWSLLLHYSPSKVGNSTVQEHVALIKSFGEALFNKRSDFFSRRQALTSSDLLVVKIMPSFFPLAVQHFIVALDEFRDQLVTYYEVYKPKASRDRLFFVPDVHRKFGDEFEDAMKEVGNDESEVWPLDHIEEHIIYLNSKK